MLIRFSGVVGCGWEDHVTEPAVVASKVEKSYGGNAVLRSVSLEVSRGEVVALLGPNGAGKTTLVEILEGYRSRDGGGVSVLGFDPARGGRRFRERIGIVLQSAGVDRRLRVAESLALFASYYPRPRPGGELLEEVGLAGLGHRRVRSLSGGERRRLDLALALVGNPEVVFLDEPTTGFDPAARRAAWRQVAALRERGCAVLLTTHSMEEAHHLADRVAILLDGALVAAGPPDELGGAGVEIRFRRLSGGPLPSTLASRVSVEGAECVLRFDDEAAAVAALGQLHQWLRDGGSVRDLRMGRPTLEDLYLRLTGQDLERPRVG
jgi:ABC-2 type transport system ATP-binding protein